MGLAGCRIFAQNGRSLIHVALRDPGSGLLGSCRLHAPNAHERLRGLDWKVTSSSSPERFRRGHVSSSSAILALWRQVSFHETRLTLSIRPSYADTSRKASCTNTVCCTRSQSASADNAALEA